VKPSNVEIILIGSDLSLAYLISRFAEQSGYRVTVLKDIPAAAEIWARSPRLILFSSMDSLELAQALMGELSDGEIPVGVCASLSDEARAYDLGADHCLLHPLTYDAFMATFAGDSPDNSLEPRQNEPDPEC